MLTFAHSCPFSIQTCIKQNVQIKSFQFSQNNFNDSHLCWQHICLRDHYICISHQRPHRQWHRNTILILLDRQILHHRMYSDDLTKCEYPLPLPNSEKQKFENCVGNGSAVGYIWHFILVIRCYFRNCMHSVVLLAMKRQHYHHATVKCHCIHWYTWPVFHLRPFSLTKNRANRMSHDMMHWNLKWKFQIWIFRDTFEL